MKKKEAGNGPFKNDIFLCYDKLFHQINQKIVNVCSWYCDINISRALLHAFSTAISTIEERQFMHIGSTAISTIEERQWMHLVL